MKVKYKWCLIGILLILVVCIIVFKSIAHKPQIVEDIPEVQEDIKALTIEQMKDIDNILQKYTNRHIISNINNEQSDVILEDLGLSNIDTYSFSVDLRDDKTYLVGLFRSSNNVEELRGELLDYINMLKVGQDTESLDTVTMYTIGEYILIVMDNQIDGIGLYGELSDILTETGLE